MWSSSSAVDAGADPETAVHLYRQIWYYTAGEILIRARRTRRQEQLDGPTYRDRTFARLDPAVFPVLSALGERWPALTSENTYAQGLHALIDGALPHRREA